MREKVDYARGYTMGKQSEVKEETEVREEGDYTRGNTVGKQSRECGGLCGGTLWANS